jgi:polysaccharide biosynthesis protein PslG
MRAATFMLVFLLFLADGRLHGVGAEPGAASSQIVTMNELDVEAIDLTADSESLSALDPLAISRDRFGIQQGGTLQFLNQNDLDRTLDGMAALGAGWLRFDMNWADIQRDGPNEYRWARYDNLIQAANARGFKVLAVLDYTPGWARPAGTTDKVPPTNPADYRRFVAAAVSRYSAAPYNVRHWEIWNEPNLHVFFAPQADVARYTVLLKEAYTAIKQIDSSSVVLTGGMSPAASNGVDIDPRAFLRGIYENGGKGYFDAVGHHPYTFPSSPESDPTVNGGDPNWSSWYIMASSNPSLRSIMEGQGDGAKKIWATEWGYPSSGGANAVSEEQQAAFTARGYQLFTSYAWAGPMFLYKYRDDCANPASYDCGHGLTRSDFSPKPAFRSYRSVVTAPGRSPATRRTIRN